MTTLDESDQSPRDAVIEISRSETARDWLRGYLPAVLFFIGLLVIWEISTATLHLIPDYLVPAPSAIAAQMLSPKSNLLYNTWITLEEILLGYLAGMVMGFGGALAVFYSKTLQRIIYPIVLLSQFVPKLAVAPLLIIWFGFSITPKILVTALVCMFPIMIDTLAGLQSADPQLLDLMHTLSARRWQVFFKIRLPAAMPNIFAGLKVGITLATIGAIVAEWIAAEAGLGYMIVFALGFFKIEQLFAALVMITLLGLLLFFLIVGLERLISPHQAHIQSSQQTM